MAMRLAARCSTALPQQYSSVKPVGDRVLVKTGGAESATEGGILLPSSATQKQTKGVVVEVGAGKGDKQPVALKAGDNVMYSQYAGTEVAFAGEEHILLKEADVIGTLADANDEGTLKPSDDRVLIRVSDAMDKTEGGLILTEAAKEKPSTGDVVAVGPGMRDESGERKALTLATGNTVLYSKFAGTEVKGKDDVEYIVVRESDVIAVLA
jgi:chaperonin GroES